MWKRRLVIFLSAGLLSATAHAANHPWSKFYDLMLAEGQSVERVIEIAQSLADSSGEAVHAELVTRLQSSSSVSQAIGRTHDEDAKQPLLWQIIRRPLESDDSVRKTISQIAALREIAQAHQNWQAAKTEISSALIDKYEAIGEADGIRRLIFVFDQISGYRDSENALVHEMPATVAREFIYSQLNSSDAGVRKTIMSLYTEYGLNAEILAALQGKEIEGKNRDLVRRELLTRIKFHDPSLESPQVIQAVHEISQSNPPPETQLAIQDFSEAVEVHRKFLAVLADSGKVQKFLAELRVLLAADSNAALCDSTALLLGPAPKEK